LRAQEDPFPCVQQIRSPYDIEAATVPEADYAVDWVQGAPKWQGCDEDAPRLIAHVETTGAPVADNRRHPAIHKALENKEILPQQR